MPVRERFSLFGGLLFWLCLLAASASVILALARPQVVTTRVRRAGIDLVVLQDGSTSMRVTDMTGDRWKRSMRFLQGAGRDHALGRRSHRDDGVCAHRHARRCG